MQCLILAGGLGTRMQEISGSRPKALLPVGSKTFLDWQLAWLERSGVTNAIIAVGVGADQIRDHVRNSRHAGLKVALSEDGPLPLGTGGAIAKALPLLESDFLVTYGDSFLCLDVEKMWETHLKSGLALTLSIYRNRNRGDRSNILYEKGRIIKYDKFSPDPSMQHIDYGMSCVKKSYFSAKMPEGMFDYAEIISQACADRQLGAFLAKRSFLEVGSPAGYRLFCEKIAAAGFDLDQLYKSFE